MYSFQDNKGKEKSSFYLFECAKITVNNMKNKKKLGAPYLRLLSNIVSFSDQAIKITSLHG